MPPPPAFALPFPILVAALRQPPAPSAVLASHLQAAPHRADVAPAFTHPRTTTLPSRPPARCLYVLKTSRHSGPRSPLSAAYCARWAAVGLRCSTPGPAPSPASLRFFPQRTARTPQMGVRCGAQLRVLPGEHQRRTSCFYSGNWGREERDNGGGRAYTRFLVSCSVVLLGFSFRAVASAGRKARSAAQSSVPDRRFRRKESGVALESGESLTLRKSDHSEEDSGLISVGTACSELRGLSKHTKIQPGGLKRGLVMRVKASPAGLKQPDWRWITEPRWQSPPARSSEAPSHLPGVVISTRGGSRPKASDELQKGTSARKGEWPRRPRRWRGRGARGLARHNTPRDKRAQRAGSNALMQQDVAQMNTNELYRLRASSLKTPLGLHTRESPRKCVALQKRSMFLKHESQRRLSTSPPARRIPGKFNAQEGDEMVVVGRKKPVVAVLTDQNRFSPAVFLPPRRQPARPMLRMRRKAVRVSHTEQPLRRTGTALATHPPKVQCLSSFVTFVGSDTWTLVTQLVVILSRRFLPKPGNRLCGIGLSYFQVKLWIGTFRFAFCAASEKYRSPIQNLSLANFMTFLSFVAPSFVPRFELRGILVRLKNVGVGGSSVPDC
ncbi:hypothetical protein C8F04DRAFT_1195092 [Mycena alexandri]|uniref:Uncharacterized protein n=1 Tax=Mycena alexandri TaxID=1745969 RepID=A0AAD6S7R8_9AGAR|nr:hypothetical protein C8F04DRAFT_1195092 [Mycena alexandri]